MYPKLSPCYVLLFPQKEDIEAALRNNNMGGLEDTLMELANRGSGGGGPGGVGTSSTDAWRSNPPLDDHPAPFDLNNPNFPQQRFPPGPHLPYTSQVITLIKEQTSSLNPNYTLSWGGRCGSYEVN